MSDENELENDSADDVEGHALEPDGRIEADGDDDEPDFEAHGFPHKAG